MPRRNDNRDEMQEHRCIYAHLRGGQLCGGFGHQAKHHYDVLKAEEKSKVEALPSTGKRKGRRHRGGGDFRVMREVDEQVASAPQEEFRGRVVLAETHEEPEDDFSSAHRARLLRALL